MLPTSSSGEAAPRESPGITDSSKRLTEAITTTTDWVFMRI